MQARRQTVLAEWASGRSYLSGLVKDVIQHCLMPLLIYFSGAQLEVRRTWIVPGPVTFQHVGSISDQEMEQDDDFQLYLLSGKGVYFLSPTVLRTIYQSPVPEISFTAYHPLSGDITATCDHHIFLISGETGKVYHTRELDKTVVDVQFLTGPTRPPGDWQPLSRKLCPPNWEGIWLAFNSRIHIYDSAAQEQLTLRLEHEYSDFRHQIRVDRQNQVWVSDNYTLQCLTTSLTSGSEVLTLPVMEGDLPRDLVKEAKNKLHYLVPSGPVRVPPSVRSKVEEEPKEIDPADYHHPNCELAKPGGWGAPLVRPPVPPPSFPVLPPTGPTGPRNPRIYEYCFDVLGNILLLQREHLWLYVRARQVWLHLQLPSRAQRMCYFSVTITNNGRVLILDEHPEGTQIWECY